MADLRFVVDGNFDDLPKELYERKCAIMAAEKRRGRRREAARRRWLRKKVVAELRQLAELMQHGGPVLAVKYEEMLSDIAGRIVAMFEEGK